VAISPLRLRFPKLILRHWTAVRKIIGYIVGRLHALLFEKREQPLKVSK
jgi:hypothetical protein